MRPTFVDSDNEGVRSGGDESTVAVNQVSHVFCRSQRCRGDCEGLHTHTHTHRISVRVGQRVASLWHNESFIKDNVFYQFTYTHIQLYTHTHTHTHAIIQILWHWCTHAFPLVKPAANTRTHFWQTHSRKYRWQHPAFTLPCAVSLFPYIMSCFSCRLCYYNL